MKVYKSKKDSLADPVSAVLIYTGTKLSDEKPVTIGFINPDR